MDSMFAFGPGKILTEIYDTGPRWIFNSTKYCRKTQENNSLPTHFRSTSGALQAHLSDQNTNRVENYFKGWFWKGRHIQIYLFYLSRNGDRDVLQQQNRELQF